MQNVVLAGNIDPNDVDTTRYRIRKFPRPGYTLFIGSQCNDGRPITESWYYKEAMRMGLTILPFPNSKNHPKAIKLPMKKKQRVTKQLLVDKYAPKTMADIIGHKDSLHHLRAWLQSWEKGYPEQRGVLVTGPPGIGKTTSVHLVATSLGYHVVEYNASDTRSVSMLRGLMALGIKRLRKEVIVMDEVDGLSERGGVGEIAAIIRKSCTPIICIANEKPPKLKPIVSACMDLKFQRPMKATIANALLQVVAAEGIRISKVELEQLCESSGNDIRSILNRLEFYGSHEEGENKDSILRMDLFSATQALFRNKRASLDEAAGLVFVDYHMVPLMVQEGYLAASGSSLEAAAKAAEYLSFGDTLDKKIHAGQDWGLIPDFVQCSVAAAKTVPGLAPFQLFPQWLGKNSKGLKHLRYMRELGEKTGGREAAEMRLDYATPLQTMMIGPLAAEKPDIKGVLARMDDLGWTRDDVMENLEEVCLEAMEVPTKVKTAFTREYNKAHKGASKKRTISDSTESDGEEEEDDMEEIREGIEELEL